jgi:hypothetical protein
VAVAAVDTEITINQYIPKLTKEAAIAASFFVLGIKIRWLISYPLINEAFPIMLV